MCSGLRQWSCLLKQHGYRALHQDRLRGGGGPVPGSRLALFSRPACELPEEPAAAAPSSRATGPGGAAFAAGGEATAGDAAGAAAAAAGFGLAFLRTAGVAIDVPALGAATATTKRARRRQRIATGAARYGSCGSCCCGGGGGGSFGLRLPLSWLA